VKVWIGFIWPSIGSSGGSCEHSSGTSHSLTEEEFLDCLSDYQLFKNSTSLSYYTSIFRYKLAFPEVPLENVYPGLLLYITASRYYSIF
jgi:hypothetical protein